MLESKIEGDTVTWAEANGWLHLKLNVRGRKGWPDHIFIKGGYIIFIEFKKPGEEPEPIQEYIHGLLKAQGMNVWVHDNTEEACGALAAVFN